MQKLDLIFMLNRLEENRLKKIYDATRVVYMVWMFEDINTNT